MPTETKELKLIALDTDDLAVVSAHLQDAVGKVGDMAYLPREMRFAMLVNRFDWTAGERGNLRCRTALRFERVLGARVRGLDLADKGAVVNLLAVEFDEVEAPGGVVTLYFSGGAAIELAVDVLEGELADLGPQWQARHRPRHVGS
jgi:hypothetical protein